MVSSKMGFECDRQVKMLTKRFVRTKKKISSMVQLGSWKSYAKEFV